MKKIIFFVLVLTNSLHGAEDASRLVGEKLGQIKITAPDKRVFIQRLKENGLVRFAGALEPEYHYSQAQICANSVPVLAQDFLDHLHQTKRLVNPFEGGLGSTSATGQHLIQVQRRMKADLCKCIAQDYPEVLDKLEKVNYTFISDEERAELQKLINLPARYLPVKRLLPLVEHQREQERCSMFKKIIGVLGFR